MLDSDKLWLMSRIAQEEVFSYIMSICKSFLDATEDERLALIASVTRPDIITVTILGRSKYDLGYDYRSMRSIRERFLPQLKGEYRIYRLNLFSDNWFKRLAFVNQCHDENELFTALFNLGIRPYRYIDRSIIYDASGEYVFSDTSLRGLSKYGMSQV